MDYKSNLIYLYDGSFDGLLCCVFECYEKKEIPFNILSDNNTFLEARNMMTELDKSNRVIKSIDLKMGKGCLDMVKIAYLSDLENKERTILDYLMLGYSVGKKLNYMLAHDAVDKMYKIVKRVKREKAQYVEFIRFNDLEGSLVSIIDPINYVLPLLAPHFITRFPNEQFMIYDRTHAMALMYVDKKSALIPIEAYDMPILSEEEKKYQQLWKLFYDTVEVKERHNERCRMNHMPKRYWTNMTEFIVSPPKFEF